MIVEVYTEIVDRYLNDEFLTVILLGAVAIFGVICSYSAIKTIWIQYLCYRKRLNHRMNLIYLDDLGHDPRYSHKPFRWLSSTQAG